MFHNKIKYRLIALLTVTISLTIVISGILLHWTMRTSLEAELGRKLETVARGAAVYFTSQELDFVSNGAGTRTLNRMNANLQIFKAATGVQRIFFFNMAHKQLLDTDTLTSYGSTLFHLQFYQTEIKSIKSDQSAHSPLFTDKNGNPCMTGFCPLYSNENLIGGVAVDGSVKFLASISSLQHSLYLIGFLGISLGVVLAALTGDTISKPIQQLVTHSRRIAEGDYSKQISATGKGEPEILARAMETMRISILKRENESKAMVAGIAHEIRNPLGGISLFAELLEDSIDADHPLAKTRIKKIRSEVDHLDKLVHHFLEYAKPHLPCPVICSLKEIFQDCQLLLNLQNEGITFNIPQIDIEIFADPLHLKQIFLNLFKNSMQAMTASSLKIITIAWQTVDNRIEIRFSDTGQGIALPKVEKIFEPFFTTREKGTGLGLSIVRDLSERNQGSIQLAKNTSKGIEFILDFPKGS